MFVREPQQFLLILPRPLPANPKRVFFAVPGLWTVIGRVESPIDTLLIERATTSGPVRWRGMRLFSTNSMVSRHGLMWYSLILTMDMTVGSVALTITMTTRWRVEQQLAVRQRHGAAVRR